MNLHYSHSIFSKKITGVFFLLLLSCAAFAQPDTWIEKADMSAFGAAARSRAVGISIGNYGYVGTGWDGSTNYPGWWRYDPASDTWTQMADFTTAPTTPGTPRRECISFSVGGFGYLGLGVNGSGTFQGLWKYDPGNNTWVNVLSMGAARSSAVSFVVGSKAYVCSGYDGGTSTYYNDLREYNPSTDTWSTKPNLPGVAREGAISFSIGAYGYVGTGYDGSISLNDFWKYNPQTNAWTQTASLPTARAYASAFSLKGKGYVVGGLSNSSIPLGDMWEYNPISNQWIQRANLGAGNRFRAVGFSVNGKGYVATGTSDGVTVESDLWEYTPMNIPAVTFQKTYGGTNYDGDTLKMSGITTSDGGYLLASSS